MAIVGILLAAGRARRFGADKRFADFCGVPLALASARALRAALPETLAVVGPDDAPLRAVLEAEGVACVACADAALGMGHSLAQGVGASPQAEGWLVALADMPRVQPGTIARLAAALSRDAIVAPAFEGRRGHPVGFGAVFRDELLALAGDVGAKPLLARHAARVRIVAVDDRGILLDADTPEALRRLAAPGLRGLA